MKIIVPMAGRGSRLRPHTLTIPKPLIPIAGKPIVHRLVEDIAGVLNQDIEEVAFIIHETFGKKVEVASILSFSKFGISKFGSTKIKSSFEILKGSAACKSSL